MTGAAGLSRRALGATRIEVTPVWVGGAPLGSMPDAFGYEVPEQRAIETVRHVLHSPINVVDTSNGYAAGRSEERIGQAIALEGGLPTGFLVATKVDPDPQTRGFDADRARRSAEESMDRLGLERIELVYLHDPEVIGFEESMRSGGVVEGLIALRDEGIASHLGVAGGPVELMQRFVRTGVFESLITHNRFTLVDRSADALIGEAAAAGLGVVNAAPFGGGILARPGSTRNYAYRPASEEVLRRIAQMESLCARHSIPLRAAALHWSLRDPRIVSTIVGVTSVEHVDELVRLVGVELPDELWPELEPLAAPSDEWRW